MTETASDSNIHKRKPKKWTTTLMQQPPRNDQPECRHRVGNKLAKFPSSGSSGLLWSSVWNTQTDIEENALTPHSQSGKQKFGPTKRVMQQPLEND
ncbi:hypothetical protein TcYC6_0002220 [Trypanosoma cruzi]|nr:hypothetical protein TcYC6_0002220 [Trypanosoma cruzi]